MACRAGANAALRDARQSAGGASCWYVLAATACLGIGCRSIDNAQVDLLERELRQQEDYIYELEDYLVEYSDKLRACRRELSEVRSQAARQKASGARKSAAGDDIPEPVLADDKRPSVPPTRAAAPPAARSGPLQIGPLDEPPPVEFGAEDNASPLPEAATEAPLEEPEATTEPDLAPEDVEAPVEAPVDATPQPAEEPLPGPAEESTEPPVRPEELDVDDLEFGEFGRVQPPAGGDPWDDAQAPPVAVGEEPATLLIPHPADFVDDGPAEASVAAQSYADQAWTEESPADLVAEPAEAPPTRLAASHVEIRRILLQPGEAGSEPALLAVVEVLSDSREPVEAEGEVSLMVMAADAPGSLQRIERWDFTAAEASSSWQSTLLGDGLHLQLPLAVESLPAGPLQLWARLVTPDGEKMLTQLVFDVASLGTLDQALAEAQDSAAQASPQLGAEAAASSASSSSDQRSAIRPVQAVDERHRREPDGWRAAPRPTPSSTASSTSGGGWTPRPTGGAGSGAPRSADVRARVEGAPSTPYWQPAR
jgi:hypothetical protein